MSKYNHVLSDENLFSSFIVSCVPDLNLEEMAQESYEIKKTIKSVSVSNNGGYQSPSFDGKKSNQKNLDSLKEIAENFAHDVVNDRGLNLPFPSVTWWVNINKNCHYNVLHNHGRADLIGVYYISAPENSGNLVLFRNDGSAYSNLYKNSYVKNLDFTIPAEVGRLYIIPGHIWHYVEPNESTEDRISVSFNIYFDC